MKDWFSFRTKLVDTLKGYSRQDFTADLIAGLTVGIVALPLAMAIISGANRFLSPAQRKQQSVKSSAGKALLNRIILPMLFLPIPEAAQ